MLIMGNATINKKKKERIRMRSILPMKGTVDMAAITTTTPTWCRIFGNGSFFP